MLAGVFGLAAGGSPNFIALASLLAVVGVGVGGTLKASSEIIHLNIDEVAQEIFPWTLPCSLVCFFFSLIA